MPPKKVLASPEIGGTVENQLRYLYARKSVLDQLIRSLEEYCEGVSSVPRKQVVSAPMAFAARSLAS
jgi:vacuolar-type H+-ATPase subunit E/Vma4